MEPIYLKIVARKWYVCDITLFIFNWNFLKMNFIWNKKDINRKPE